jgi:hypothetical protein
VANISLDKIIRHLLAFVLVIVACLSVITYVPSMSLYLRDVVYAKVVEPVLGPASVPAIEPTGGANIGPSGAPSVGPSGIGPSGIGPSPVGPSPVGPSPVGPSPAPGPSPAN